MNILLVKKEKKLIDFFHLRNKKIALASFLVALLHQYQVNGRQLLPEKHGNVRQRLGKRNKDRTPNTPAKP